jgi:hypothetical protein
MGGNFFTEHGVDKPGDRGPKAGHDCVPIQGSKGKETSVMGCCFSKTTHIALPGHDCHNFIHSCLTDNGLPDPTIYGRDAGAPYPFPENPWWPRAPGY